MAKTLGFRADEIPCRNETGISSFSAYLAWLPGVIGDAAPMHKTKNVRSKP